MNLKRNNQVNVSSAALKFSNDNIMLPHLPFFINSPKVGKKMTFLVCLSLFCMLAFLGSSYENCWANPLTGGRTPPSQAREIESASPPSVFAKLITKITILQMQIKQKIAANVHNFKRSGTIAPLLPLFLLSFLYGAVHAAGPGHGKAIAMSYALSRGKGYLSGFFLGGLIAVIHACSAIGLVFLLRYILEKTITTSLESATQVTQVFSYGLISCIGLYLLGTGLYALHKGNASHDTQPASQRHFANPFTAALAIGIVPCPGVIMILLFCLSLEQSVLGLLLCVAVSLGMAMTISIAVWVSITGKKLALHLTGNTEQGFHGIEQILSCISGVLLTTMGGLFLIASFQA